jgi:hypothetical protein
VRGATLESVLQVVSPLGDVVGRTEYGNTARIGPRLERTKFTTGRLSLVVFFRELTECHFGPIPESESAEEPFLAPLQAGEIIWYQVEEPPTGAVLEWYWRSSAAGSAWPAGPAWPWEAATAIDGLRGPIKRDDVAQHLGEAHADEAHRGRRQPLEHQRDDHAGEKPEVAPGDGREPRRMRDQEEGQPHHDRGREPPG